VNAGERLAKLEAILARVMDRAKALRGVRAESAAAPPSIDGGRIDADGAEARPDLLAASASREILEQAPPVVIDVTPPPASVDVEVEVVDIREVSEPPIPIELSSEQEVQSSERIVSAPEEALAGEAEGERPASVAPTEGAADPRIESSPDPESRHVPDYAPDYVPDYLPEPPASSRRPIALESKLEDLAFGDAAPPEAPHTPPPESGRQVASPPAVDLDFDSDFTGVRSRASDSAEGAVVRSHAPSSFPPPAEVAPLDPAGGGDSFDAGSGGAATVAPASDERAKVRAEVEAAVAPLAVAATPDITLPSLPDAPVAVFEGNVPLFKPASFGELLEATLAL
jgi:hypothetical protein